MKIRLFVEIELDDVQLLKAVDEKKLPQSQCNELDLGASFGRTIEGLVRQMPTVTGMGSVIIPQVVKPTVFEAPAHFGLIKP